MMVGIQPTGWTNDDFPEIGNDTPYQVILDQTEQTDFNGGSTGHNYPAHLPSLLVEMKRRNLQIASTWCGTAFTTGTDIDSAFKAFEAQVAFLEAVGSHDVVVAELAGAVNQDRTKSVLNHRPILNDLQWFLLTKLLDRAGEYARAKKMQLSYHPHVGTGVMTIAETERLLKSTGDSVGLCLDTAHLCYGGADQKELVDLTDRHKHRITHVHIKNTRESVRLRAMQNEYSFYRAIREGIFTVPGDPEGELDLVPILKILKDAEFKGWMVVEAEQDPAKANPLEYAKMARAFLLKHWG
jgi:inosose dehydratase